MIFWRQSLKFRNSFFVGMFLCSTVFAQESALPCVVSQKKIYKGNYIYVYPNQREPAYFNGVLQELEDLPGFVGVQKKYFWENLEPEFDIYDFSEIESDLARLNRVGKKLVLSFQAESFNTGKKHVPQYLLSEFYSGGVYPIETGSGFNLAYFNKNVVSRVNRLVVALAKNFDGHPALAAINFEETSPSIRDSAWQKKYLDDYLAGMLDIARVANKSFKNTVVLQYVNYPENRLAYIFSFLCANSIGFGGPDVKPKDKFLVNNVYRFYDQYSKYLPVGVAVDYDNYQNSGAGIDIPSPQYLYCFALFGLKADYIFWLRRTKDSFGIDFWSSVLSFFRENKFEGCDDKTRK